MVVVAEAKVIAYAVRNKLMLTRMPVARIVFVLTGHFTSMTEPKLPLVGLDLTYPTKPDAELCF